MINYYYDYQNLVYDCWLVGLADSKSSMPFSKRSKVSTFHHVVCTAEKKKGMIYSYAHRIYGIFTYILVDFNGRIW